MLIKLLETVRGKFTLKYDKTQGLLTIYLDEKDVFCVDISQV